MLLVRVEYTGDLLGRGEYTSELLRGGEYTGKCQLKENDIDNDSTMMCYETL